MAVRTMIGSHEQDGARHLYDTDPDNTHTGRQPGAERPALCGKNLSPPPHETTTDEPTDHGLPEDRNPLCDHCATAYRKMCTRTRQPSS